MRLSPTLRRCTSYLTVIRLWKERELESRRQQDHEQDGVKAGGDYCRCAIRNRTRSYHSIGNFPPPLPFQAPLGRDTFLRVESGFASLREGGVLETSAALILTL